MGNQGLGFLEKGHVCRQLTCLGRRCGWWDVGEFSILGSY